MSGSKNIYAKIYDESGNFLETLFDFTRVNFAASINGGVGSLNLTLARPYDDQFLNLDFNNNLKIYEASTEHPNGVLVYNGYIADRRSKSGENEEVEILVVGYWSKLAMDIATDGAANLLITYSSQDTGAMIRDLISKYRTQNSGTPIEAVTTTEVPNVSNSITLNINGMNFQQAILEAKDNSGVKKFVYLDTDNKLYLRSIDLNTVDHYFMYKRDIQEIQYQESIVEMRNGIYFWNGVESGVDRIMKIYSDSTSIASYGKQFDLKKDGRYSVEGSAATWADRWLDAFKDPIVTLDLKLFDKVYNGISKVDITSVKPGDTFKIVEIDPDSPFAGKVFYITQTVYNDGEYLNITSVDPQVFVARQIKALAEEIQNESWGKTHSQPYT